ncbi:hypothetical protein ACFWPH_28745 [Nocardia sp. NPDC058499]|uniref:hypothetical protein n=1 Tax=Nocardia sp. NPDC058499 TaxID=3346530 RepID=UPI00365956D2
MALQRRGVLAGTYGASAAERDQPAAGATQADLAVEAREQASDRAPAKEAEPNQERALSSVSEPASAGQGTASSIQAPVDPAGKERSRQEPAKKSQKASKTEKDSADRQAPLKAVAKAKRTQLREDENARLAVENSYRSAKRRPREWGNAGIRISTTVKARLATRRALDEEVFGVKFAETHYIDAALARVPENAHEAIKWVHEYLDAFDLKGPTTVGTTGRLRHETSERLDRVARAMRMEAGYGYIGHLQTAAVDRLLDSLDRWDSQLQPRTTELDDTEY